MSFFQFVVVLTVMTGFMWVGSWYKHLPPPWGARFAVLSWALALATYMILSIYFEFGEGTHTAMVIAAFGIWMAFSSTNPIAQAARQTSKDIKNTEED